MENDLKIHVLLAALAVAVASVVAVALLNDLKIQLCLRSFKSVNVQINFKDPNLLNF